jgi:hypothetical protein
MVKMDQGQITLLPDSFRRERNSVRMKPLYRVLAVGTAIWLAGCATAGGRLPRDAPVSVARPEPVPAPPPAAAPEPIPAPSPAPAPTAGVGFLVASAERQIASGQHEQAAASLERALRIEPRNARLWNRLAAVRFEQGQWSAAVQFASKSNQLAGPDGALRAANYRLMADSYERLGQWQKAGEARRMADKP